MSATSGTRGWLRGNLLWLSLVSLLNDVASAMIYPLLPFFLTSTLGAGPALLGAIEGAAESASSVLKLLGGWVSDRFRRRPLISAGYAISAAARPLIGLALAPWHVLALRLSDRFGKGIRTAPRDALLAASVPAERRGTAFGVHRAADHLGAAIGPLLASALLVGFGGALRPVFALAALPGVLAALLVIWKVREVRLPSAERPAEPEVLGAPSSAALDPTFIRYLAVLVVFTLGNATDAFLLLRAADVGVTVAAVPLLWSVHHVSKSAFSVPGGILSDRLGPRLAIALGFAVYAAVYTGFAFASAPWQAWVLFIVYGAFHGLTEAPQKALVARLAPAGRSGTAFGVYHATIGIAALPASILFGALWAAFGPRVPFLVGAALALSACVLLPFVATRR